jgi:photosystem II stability/assembly factor-like uncharacterized protein
MKNINLKNIFVVLLLQCSIFSVYAQWKSLPIRSQVEFYAGAAGGEGEQWFHGFSRCLTQPDYVYAAQDVCGAWRSTDGGTSWKKCRDKGLYLAYSQSIEVDPIDPNRVFIVVDQSSVWMGSVLLYEGVYQSIDGGQSWNIVLNTTETSVRKMRHLIAFSLPSMVTPNTSPTRWFTADNQSLWRSDASGNAGTWTKVANIPTTAVVTDVVTHPTSIDTVYVATESGLYRSTNGGSNLAEIAQFTGKKVTAVLLNKALPNEIYVTVSADGVYYSADNGASFTKKTITIGGIDVSSSIYRAVMNPGFPEQIYLIGAESSNKTWVTNDGMLNWQLLPSSTTFPGLGREIGWRRYFDGPYAAICPNSVDKTSAIGMARATFHKITNSGAAVAESATGFTGNASMQTDRSIAFHPNNASVFGIFCYDVGPRITHSAGDWFTTSDPIIYSWRTKGIIKWSGSYSAAFQPVNGSGIVLASIGHYTSGGQSQIMRSTDNGLSWGESPVTVVNGDVTAQLQPYHFVGFDPETPTIAYAGSLKSVDAGLTFSSLTFPATYATPSLSYAPVPSVCGISKDPITGKSSVFAIDGNRRYILRSDDKGANWFLFADLTALGGSAKYLDSSPTFAAHPTNPNVIFALDAQRDLMKVTYISTTKPATKVSLNSFAALPSWIPAGVKTFNQVRRIGIDPVDPNVMYVSMLASGIPSVLRTLDGGVTWASISDDLNYQGGCLVVNPHTRQVYKGSMSGTSIYPAPPLSGIEAINNNFNSTLKIHSTAQTLYILTDTKSANFRINDLATKVVIEFQGNSVDISHLEAGIYILRSDKYPSVKFIKTNR